MRPFKVLAAAAVVLAATATVIPPRRTRDAVRPETTTCSPTGTPGPRGSGSSRRVPRQVDRLHDVSATPATEVLRLLPPKGVSGQWPVDTHRRREPTVCAAPATACPRMTPIVGRELAGGNHRVGVRRRLLQRPTRNPVLDVRPAAALTDHSLRRRNEAAEQFLDATCHRQRGAVLQIGSDDLYSDGQTAGGATDRHGGRRQIGHRR